MASVAAGKVLAFRKRQRGPGRPRKQAGEVVAWPGGRVVFDRATVLADLQAREAAGNMRGLMYFSEGSDGRITYGVMGSFADRMQLANHTLLQAIVHMTDKIIDAGDAGHTSSADVVHD